MSTELVAPRGDLPRLQWLDAQEGQPAGRGRIVRFGGRMVEYRLASARPGLLPVLRPGREDLRAIRRQLARGRHQELFGSGGRGAAPAGGGMLGVGAHLTMAESLLDALVPQLYDELHALAARAMRGERSDHTLQPTAVVNEAYLRLAASSRLDLSERPRVLALAAKAIRHVLVDHARRKRAKKRPGSALRVTLSESSAVADPTLDWLALDEALDRLEATDARAARIFELRALGGLEVEEVAALLGISAPTVKRDFAVAKAFLHRELTGSAPGDAPA